MDPSWDGNPEIFHGFFRVNKLFDPYFPGLKPKKTFIFVHGVFWGVKKRYPRWCINLVDPMVRSSLETVSDRSGFLWGNFFEPAMPF